MKKMLMNRGFTDKLYWYNFRAVWWFTCACFILNTISGYLGVGELAIITYGIPAAFGELALHTGFIIWKSKSENFRKHPEIKNMEEQL